MAGRTINFQNIKIHVRVNYVVNNQFKQRLEEKNQHKNFMWFNYVLTSKRGSYYKFTIQEIRVTIIFIYSITLSSTNIQNILDFIIPYYWAPHPQHIIRYTKAHWPRNKYEPTLTK